VGEGHQFGGLVGGISEHVALISSTDVFVFSTDVDSLGDIRGLLFDGDEDVAGLVIESFGRIVESNSFNGISDDLLVVEMGFGGDFSENHDHTGLGGGFTSNLRVWVLS